MTITIFLATSLACLENRFSSINHTLTITNTRGEVEDTRLEAKAKDTKKKPRPRPRTGMLEAKAKDQGHKGKCSPKSQKFFRRSPQKHVFQKIFQALHKILAIQKIVLSSSRGQANFRGLEASRPRPRT